MTSVESTPERATTLDVTQAIERPAAVTHRRIAVVPAYNEEATVAAVLERLAGLVDELVVVDDGSTDATRAEIEAWLPGHDHVRLIVHERNQGMSAAYYTAFLDLRRRIVDGGVSADDLVYTIDADGQHELAVLDELQRIMLHDGLDALLVQRDLEGYPLYKQLGNRLLSAWATLWAGGPLLDVESGYRIFRAGALANALDYYQGYKYSETVEVAVVLSRLGYKVRNDVLVPVPIYRSRTRMVDVVIDLCAIPAAAVRVQRRAPASEPVPSLAKPVAVTAAFAAAGLAGAYAGWRLLRASVSRWLKHRTGR
jgi:glycosyltransferase involved in cell wall biosynthesis